jgi:hypothetical protein
VRKLRFGLQVDIITPPLQFIRTMRGLTPIFGSFSDADFDEARFERHLEADPRLAVASCLYWVRKLQALVFANDYATALAAATQAERFFWTSETFFQLAEYHLYAALARAALCDRGVRRRAGPPPRGLGCPPTSVREVGRELPGEFREPSGAGGRRDCAPRGSRDRRRASVRTSHPLGARQQLRPQ